ncbi:thiamine-phosphate diphosphorylase [Parasphingorhabdus marina DSM 22363]|uniref:Thiamine-phosphate synthase n=1 Tax=Parasphingorhabdus marina DSM 22363 TaxID=1123272 RepID=A0A1N6G2C7_9SPHN|nr:thiamine phosphate synthase [Parasphingorhabdus marina]SIO01695.1 thiamine-phosphate diphosphorylase [Parasphingorhabdus marina DSM 22363]
MSEAPPCQLYLISPPDVSGSFPDQLRNALAAGPVAAFQFRVKDVALEEAVALAQPLQAICDEHDVAFVVNDDVELAQKLDADGVHLGQSDMALADARKLLGDQVQIGITCHDSRHLAMEAGEAGANYVAFGAFFPTQTKETTHKPDVDILEWWSRVMEIPCVAIGGITPDNCGPLIKAGADFLAVSGAVWSDPQGPASAVARFSEILDQQ